MENILLQQEGTTQQHYSNYVHNLHLHLSKESYLKPVVHECEYYFPEYNFNIKLSQLQAVVMWKHSTETHIYWLHNMIPWWMQTWKYPLTKFWQMHIFM
jgi:hypothetical protein